MPDRLTAAELQAIRERESKATKGPWDADETGDIGTDTVMPPPRGHESSPPCGAVLFQSDSATPEDCAFAACARTDIPRLLATIAHLAAVIHEACEAERQMGLALKRFQDWQERQQREEKCMSARAALFQAEEEYHEEKCMSARAALFQAEEEYHVRVGYTRTDK